MRRFNRDNYKYDQRRNYYQTYYQKSNKREDYRRYDYNKYEYNNYNDADYEGRFGLKRHKDSYNNTPDLSKRMIKRLKMMDKEQEGVDSLINGYKFSEAHNFFKRVCESEVYPTLIWDDDEVDLHRLWKIDFGKFDQRQKFINMFENYDRKGINISIHVDFSYGGFRHDMFIEQSMRGHKYSTDNFLFQNCVTFNDEPNSDYVSYMNYIKPYLSRKEKNGILAKFIKYPEKIQNFAVNVSRIMKLSPKGIIPINNWNMDIDRILTFEAFEIAGMILSTERLRSKKSLLLSCIEFYKLKHTSDEDKLSMLLDMFDKDGPILKFPASPGGIEYIQNTHYYFIYRRFLDMIKYSPDYPIIQQCKNKDTQQKLMDEFFRGKLEKIRAVLENRQPKFKSGFKAAVKEIKTNSLTYNSSSSNAKSDTVLQNEISHKDTNSSVSTVENNLDDEYFDTYSSNLSDTDYDSIFTNTASQEFSSSQQIEIVDTNNINKDVKDDQKVENTSDEYFDGYLDNFSDKDYDSIFNNAIQSPSDHKN